MPLYCGAREVGSGKPMGRRTAKPRREEARTWQRRLKVTIKLEIPAGRQIRRRPLVRRLGQAGLNIMEFCKAFNAATQNSDQGTPTPVVITVLTDTSFTLKPRRRRHLLPAQGREAAKGQWQTPGPRRSDRCPMAQLREIAEAKMVDLNANDMDAAMRR